MSTVLETVTDLQDRALEGVGQVQDRIVEALSQAVESGEGFVPELSARWADRLPAVRQVAATQFDFAGRLLDQQRAFVDEVIDAAKPVAEKIGVVVEADIKKTSSKKAA
jgi:hypothetical protein